MAAELGLQDEEEDQDEVEGEEDALVEYVEANSDDEAGEKMGNDLQAGQAASPQAPPPATPASSEALGNKN